MRDYVSCWISGKRIVLRYCCYYLKKDTQTPQRQYQSTAPLYPQDALGRASFTSLVAVRNTLLSIGIRGSATALILYVCVRCSRASSFGSC